MLSYLLDFWSWSRTFTPWGWSQTNWSQVINSCPIRKVKSLKTFIPSLVKIQLHQSILSLQNLEKEECYLSICYSNSSPSLRLPELQSKFLLVGKFLPILGLHRQSQILMCPRKWDEANFSTNLSLYFKDFIIKSYCGQK